jgi:hypothetical protein
LEVGDLVDLALAVFPAFTTVAFTTVAVTAVGLIVFKDF